jgi:KUP system potassium uptake protein
MTDGVTAPAGADGTVEPESNGRSGAGLLALALGSLGVVYGDIGTSRLYAFREAIRAASVEFTAPVAGHDR